jgi:hypothetical protein
VAVNPNAGQPLLDLIAWINGTVSQLLAVTHISPLAVATLLGLVWLVQACM